MAEVDSMLLEIDSEIKNSNIVKDIVLARLADDGVIPKEVFETYSEKWQIIVVKKSWFRKWMDKFAKDKEDAYIYKYVRFED